MWYEGSDFCQFRMVLHFFSSLAINCYMFLNNSARLHSPLLNISLGVD